MLRSVLTFLFVASLPGCGPAVLLKAPENWPGECRSRRLYHTPQGYIYASGDAAAGEIDRLIKRVAAEFQRDNARVPGKALYVVTDVKDPRAVDDLRSVARCAKRRGGWPNEAAYDEAKFDREWTKDEREMAETGISMDLLIGMAPLDLPTDELASLMGMPECVAADAPGAVLLPTTSFLSMALDKSVEAGLKKEGIGIVARAAMAPLIAMFKPLMVDMLVKMCEVAVYSGFVRSQTDWSNALKGEKISNYLARKTGEAQRNIHAAVSSQPGLATSESTTRPVEMIVTPASQPETTSRPPTQPATSAASDG